MGSHLFKPNMSRSLNTFLIEKKKDCYRSKTNVSIFCSLVLKFEIIRRLTHPDYFPPLLKRDNKYFTQKICFRIFSLSLTIWKIFFLKQMGLSFYNIPQCFRVIVFFTDVF
jgi:hypothetical protein